MNNPSVKTYSVLFLCTGNTARSIMAEALLNRLGGGRFHAYSAGSHPAGAIHPLALELLTQSGHSVEHLRSKSWHVFLPRPRHVFTLCDKTARETCPAWPGRPITAHWGLEDPAAVSGAESVRRKTFVQVYRHLTNRVQILLSLPIEKLDPLKIEHRVREIGVPTLNARVDSLDARESGDQGKII